MLIIILIFILLMIILNSFSYFRLLFSQLGNIAFQCSMPAFIYIQFKLSKYSKKGKLKLVNKSCKIPYKNSLEKCKGILTNEKEFILSAISSEIS